MEYVLKTHELRKTYFKTTALDSVTMSVPRGAIYGFVGRNGAGKTTLMRLICGLQSPTSGSYELFGVADTDRDITKTHRRTGAMIEHPTFFDDMTAQQNLRMQYDLLGLPSYDGIDELLKMVALNDAGNKKARDFSLGMKQKLGIAIALCGKPDLLMLDEPVNGLDPQGIIEIRELIIRLNRENNVTFLISSHILDELAKVATHYGFIDKGRIVREIGVDELEKELRSYLCLRVSDMSVFSRIMDKNGIDYKVMSDDEAYIYDSFTITELSDILSAESCKLLSVSEHKEGIEKFFLELVGGGEAE